MNRMSDEVNSPWGEPQTWIELVPGIIRVTTASHGGYRLSPERRAAMKARLGIDLEWYEEDDEGQVVRGVFAVELGFADGEALLSQVPEEVLAYMREVSEKIVDCSALQATLIKHDANLQSFAEDEEPVPPDERQAFVLAAQMSHRPEPLEHLDWLLRECMSQAAYTRVLDGDRAAIFAFPDRSILAVLNNGKVFGLPTGASADAARLMLWLMDQGITAPGPGAKRKALPAGAVIEFCGVHGVVVSDPGGMGQITVLSEGIRSMWVWMRDGVFCTLVSLPDDGDEVLST